MKNQELENKKIALLIADEFQDLEAMYPYYRMKEAGAEVYVIGSGKSEYTGKYGWTQPVDNHIADVDVDTFDAVIIPGGWAPDHMRRDKNMVEFVHQAYKRNKLVAAICHAGWLLITANVLQGREATSYHSIKMEMMNAGAKWVDKPVVEDANLITSRNPDDLPVFCKAIVENLRNR